jgi:SAM-dependent methyltransferase
LIWIDPQPVPEEFNRIYLGYHSPPSCSPSNHPYKQLFEDGFLAERLGYEEIRPSAFWSRAARILCCVPSIADGAALSVRLLGATNRGRLLDVGCGTGTFLGRMYRLGWDVVGIDPDATAIEYAKKVYGIPVVCGTLATAGIEPESVDAITLHHVIEHVHDPIKFLKECVDRLRPGGVIVLVTPNIGSMAHRIFRSRWRGLEPPRHFNLFSSKSLRGCLSAAGFPVADVRTTARAAREMYWVSWQVATGHQFRSALRSPLRYSLGWLLQIAEDVVPGRGVGEEVVAFARKPSR